MSLRKIVVVNNNSPGFENIIDVVRKYPSARIVDVHQKDLVNLDLSEILNGTYALVLSGGFEHLNQNAKEVLAEKKLVDLAIKDHVPVLGICYGFQLLSYFYGRRKLEKLGSLLLDAVKVDVLKKDVIFHEVNELVANQWHEEYIPYVDDKFGEFEVLATSEHNGKKVVEAIKSRNGLIYGVQFHPERMSDEANADKVIFNFLDMFI